MTRHQEFMQRNSYPYSYQGEGGDQTDLRKRGAANQDMDLNFDAVADKPFIPGMGKLDFNILSQGGRDSWKGVVGKSSRRSVHSNQGIQIQ